MTSAQPQPVYAFGGFRLEPRSRSLRGPGGPVAVTAKAFDALVYLVEHAGELVERARLIDVLWPKTVVEDNNLNQAVVALRRVLGDGFIATIPGRGYQFVAPVTTLTLAPTPTAVTPRRRFRITRVWAAFATMVGIFVVGVVLYAMSRAPIPPTTVRLAILPFENLSPDAEDAFFADGLHWEISSAIVRRAPGLDVVSRRTMQQYRGTAKPLTELATELGATHVLEGSVRREGDDVRLVLQLSDGRSDKLLWSHDYPRKRQDTMALEAEVADAVATQLLGRKVPDELSAPPTNPEAYDSYLKGKLALRELSGYRAEREWRAAEAEFSDAIARDPKFWRAYLDRANVRRLLIANGYTHSVELVAAEQGDLEMARELAPDEPLVLVAEAEAAIQSDPAHALELFERAEARGLTDAELLWPKVAILLRLGRWHDGLALLRRLVALDPGNGAQLDIAWFQFMWAHEPADALRVMDLALASQPGDKHLRWQRAQTLFLFTGDIEPWEANDDADVTAAPGAITFEEGAAAIAFFKSRRFFGRYAELRRYLDAVRVEALRNVLIGHFVVPSVGETPVAELRGWTDLLLGEPDAARNDAEAIRSYVDRRAASDNNRWYLTLLLAEAELFDGEPERAMELAHEALAPRPVRDVSQSPAPKKIMPSWFKPSCLLSVSS